MKKKNIARLNESQLKRIIAESVMESIMGEIGKGKVMPPKYKDIFTRRVQNAMHGHIGEVEKVVNEFYLQFKDKIRNEGFTLDYLMDLADKIEGGGTGGHGNPGMGRQRMSDGWWATNAEKYLEENKKNIVRINESQLRKLIKESVRKVMNEDMFYGGKGLEGDDVIRINPSTRHNVWNDIRNGVYDDMIAKNIDAILNEDDEWFESHIDVVAQNMDTASDMYIDTANILIERAREIGRE